MAWRRRTGSIKSPDASDVEIGRAIRIQRLLHGMSQQALAEQLGVSFQQLQKYEKGSNRVGGGRLSRIASIFSVPIATLFEGTAAEGSRPAEASALRLIADRQPMRLVQAFAQLRNRNIRLSIVKLVERLAKDSPTRHRRACPGDPDELSKSNVEGVQGD